jgi:hypothetical protein
MKQIILLFVFVCTAGIASAQCQMTASCCKNKTATASVEQSAKACASMGVVEASSIQKRIDNVTGEVTYFEKSTSADGSIAWTKLSAEEANKKMTKVASVGMEKTPSGEVKTTNVKCAAGPSASCCKDKKQVN